MSSRFLTGALNTLLLAAGLLLLGSAAKAQTPKGTLAPKPLFRDPAHDGAADPTLIWNRAKHEWWMFYTNRRADMATSDPKDVAWVHGTRIGVATSRDGAHWKYRGVADIQYGEPDYTQWAPDVVYWNGNYHMFLTIVPGTFHDWNAPRSIIHLTSSNLERWTYVQKFDAGSDRIIDPSLFQMTNGGWRLWFKDERDHSHIHYADSTDLQHWIEKGAAITDRGSEAPKVFRWHNAYWMLTDTGHGLGAYRSSDLTHWEPQHNLLDEPGTLPTDRSQGKHCDVIVHGDRAFIYYFTHQSGADLDAAKTNSARRTLLQVAELQESQGVLSVDRNQPVYVDLGK